MFRINFNLIVAIIASVFFQVIAAQQNETFVAKFTMSSADEKISSTINYIIKPKDLFDGYFITQKHIKSIFGYTGRGGYDYLNHEEFGSEPKYLIPKWIENDSPLLGDLEGFLKDSDVKTVLSFRITPVYSSNPKSNKIAYLLKFAVINQNEKNALRGIDIESKTKVFYKVRIAEQNGIINLDFLKTVLPDYNFELVINKINEDQIVLKADKALFSVIKNSVQEANLDKNIYSFSAELGIYPPKEIGFFQHVNCLRSYELINFSNIFKVTASGNDTLNLAQPIYKAEIKLPFVLYNEDKMKIYQHYKSYREVFHSTYNVLIVPISNESEKLTVDIIVEYAKLNLNDLIPRWSPFKKRLTFEHKQCLIEMPQENWSAVFSKENDKYEVYGYSDYEKYISELLFVNLNHTKKEN